MRRILPFVTLGLFVLVIADRFAKTMPTTRVSQGASASTPVPAPAAASPLPAQEDARSATVSDMAASTVDRLARLATRRQLNRMSAGTYIDSLISTTDSVLRRWPDRRDPTLRVFIREGGDPGYQPRMARLFREALSRWEEAGVGVTFRMAGDSASADIVVQWIDRFTIDRAGQTDLTWDQRGHVHHASILLALRTNSGFDVLDAPMLAVAVHEVGHAIGLPHSADSNDVMFPATRTGVLSARDRKTAQLLYHLAPGPLRDEVTVAP